jgi:hypothetical protein
MKIEIDSVEQYLRLDLSELRFDTTVASFIDQQKSRGKTEILITSLDGVFVGLTRWLWLSVHARTARGEAWPQVKGRTLEWIEVFKGSVGEDFVSDFFMMISAVLSGDPKILAEAAAASHGADPALTTNQFFAAFAGVLKHRILKDKAAERVQLEILGRKKPKPLFRGCRAKIVQAFVESDWTVFKREVRKTLQDEWKKLKEEERVSESASGKITVDFGSRQYYRYPASKGVPYQAWWDRDALFPWCEAAMSALAIREGVEIEGDPLWMPDTLVGRPTVSAPSP